VPRMRTIVQAARYVKAADPGTALTETALRRLLTTGAVPSVRIGVKFLVDLDVLDDFLTGGVQTVKSKVK